MLCPRAGRALHFWLDPKTKQKGQGIIKKIMILIAIPKCGRVIFEQVLSFPILLRHCFNSNDLFHDAEWRGSNVFLEVSDLVLFCIVDNINI